MRVRLVAAVVGCLCLIPLPALASPCEGFTDVDSTDPYCAAVAFVKDKGITVGCSSSTLYCPNDFVTRAQMASFMLRLARGGSDNTLADSTSSIGGGDSNSATSLAVVSGGYANHASGIYASVAGGAGNTASGLEATVSGGYSNTASGSAAIVLGGMFNVASGDDSIAAGHSALANQTACVVFALLNTGTAMDCNGASNTFRIGAQHGFSVDYDVQQGNGLGDRYLVIGGSLAHAIEASSGAILTDGGTWTNASDRNAKTDFAAIDPQTVLDKVAAMPLSTWRYKAEAEQRHLGPMAQDFYAAFGLGADDRHITTVDEGGVALAAIKGLNQKVDARDARIADLEAGNAELRARLAAIERKLQ